MPATDAAESARENLDRWREQASENCYAGDGFIRRLLHCHLGPRWAEADALLRAVSDQAGPRLDAFVMESNRDENLPRLRRHDHLVPDSEYRLDRGPGEGPARPSQRLV